jgi:TRAP-type C4-dicarboxylate transport system permease small subunit
MIRRLWSWLVDGLGALGSVMTAALMVLICADVAVRNTFNTAIPVVAEIAALSVVTILFLQLATTVQHDRLARTEIVVAVLARRWPRVRMVLEGVYDLIGATVCGLIAWSTYGGLVKELRAGEFIGVLGVLTLPVWPFRVLILVGVGVAAAHFLFRGIGRVVRPGSGAA